MRSKKRAVKKVPLIRARPKAGLEVCFSGYQDKENPPVAMAIRTGFWYNLSMQKPNCTDIYYTPIQLKLPLEIEKIIDISDPVYSFREVLDCIDLSEFLAVKECRTGRPRCDAAKLLKTQQLRSYLITALTTEWQIKGQIRSPFQEQRLWNVQS